MILMVAPNEALNSRIVGGDWLLNGVDLRRRRYAISRAAGCDGIVIGSGCGGFFSNLIAIALAGTFRGAGADCALANFSRVL